jgi:hypothetical protein
MNEEKDEEENKDGNRTKEHRLRKKKMTNRESPSVQGRIRRILSRVQLFRRDKEKYAERIKEENKRIQKDKILDEEEDEEKEEEDEYVDHYEEKEERR